MKQRNSSQQPRSPFCFRNESNAWRYLCTEQQLLQRWSRTISARDSNPEHQEAPRKHANWSTGRPPSVQCGLSRRAYALVSFSPTASLWCKVMLSMLRTNLLSFRNAGDAAEWKSGQLAPHERRHREAIVVCRKHHSEPKVIFFFARNHRIVIVLDLELIAQGAGKIGNPANVDDGAQTTGSLPSTSAPTGPNANSFGHGMSADHVGATTNTFATIAVGEKLTVIRDAVFPIRSLNPYQNKYGLRQFS